MCNFLCYCRRRHGCNLYLASWLAAPSHINTKKVLLHSQGGSLWPLRVPFVYVTGKKPDNPMK